MLAKIRASGRSKRAIQYVLMRIGRMAERLYEALRQCVYTEIKKGNEINGLSTATSSECEHTKNDTRAPGQIVCHTKTKYTVYVIERLCETISISQQKRWQEYTQIWWGSQTRSSRDFAEQSYIPARVLLVFPLVSSFCLFIFVAAYRKCVAFISPCHCFCLHFKPTGNCW